jgi:hypothetical protein
LDYYETSLEFIESDEMREHIRNTVLLGNIPDKMRVINPDRDCRDIIVGSRAGIDQKLEALRKMPPDTETLELIKVAELALADTKTTCNNVFLLTSYYEHSIDDLMPWSEREPCLSFESVLEQIRLETAGQCKMFEETIEQCMDHVWYQVEKFIPEGNGKLVHKISWHLNAKGEIIFFELGDDFENLTDDSPESWAWWDWKDRESVGDISTPFDFGDIVTIDMRPFYTDVRGVVVRSGDTREAGSNCIYADDEGFLHYGIFHHNFIWYPPMISPFYRAERFKGKLPENEHMLEKISEAIKKVPSIDKADWREHPLADQYVDFIMEDRNKGYRFSCSWDEFRKEFGL